MSEPFALRNDPPKRKPWKAENALPARQTKLFTGCNDLPGQSSLFNADGPRETEPVAPRYAGDVDRAKQLYIVYTANGAIGRMFGPAKATCRAHILSALHGVNIPKSRAPWGKFCEEMFRLYDITGGGCLAEREDMLADAAKAFYEATR